MKIRKLLFVFGSFALAALLFIGSDARGTLADGLMPPTEFFVSADASPGDHMFDVVLRFDQSMDLCAVTSNDAWRIPDASRFADSGIVLASQLVGSVGSAGKGIRIGKHKQI